MLMSSGNTSTDTQSEMLENLHLEAIRIFVEVYAELDIRNFTKNSDFAH